MDEESKYYPGGYEDPDIGEFLSLVTKRICPNCGKAVWKNPYGRQPVFCDDNCRKQFWNRNPRPEVWKCYEERKCPVCGKKFMAKKKGAKTQRFCSIACSNRARGKEFEGRDDIMCINRKVVIFFTGTVIILSILCFAGFLAGGEFEDIIIGIAGPVLFLIGILFVALLKKDEAVIMKEEEKEEEREKF